MNKSAKARLIKAIEAAEAETSGEIRVHVKLHCGQDPAREASQVFHRLGMHKTGKKNGVLIFVATNSRRFAIIGDEGIHKKVGDGFWHETRDLMAQFFSKNDIIGGIEAGIASVGMKLKAHFPVETGDRNELSDTISEG